MSKPKNISPPKPITLALVSPFDTQPSESAWAFSAAVNKILAGPTVEVVNLTPSGFLTDLTKSFPPLQRAVALIERLLFSSGLLRARLGKERLKAAKNGFVVLLSDASLGILGGALRDFKVITFVNDLIALRASQGEFGQPTSFGRRFNERATLAGLINASEFLVPTRATANDLQQVLASSTEHTTLTPLPTPPAFAPLAPAELAARLNELWRTQGIIPPRYFLMSGSAEWYKNRLGVLRAMRQLGQQMPNPPCLVFAGAPATPEEAALAQQAGVKLYSFREPSEADLTTLYAGAEALLTPSFIEGFGSRALEALPCGVPLVISDTPALVECFGEAAAVILPNPAEGEADAWATVVATELKALLEISDDLRGAIVEQGMQQAGRFSPERFRSTVMGTVEKVLRDNS